MIGKMLHSSCIFVEIERSKKSEGQQQLHVSKELEEPSATGEAGSDSKDSCESIESPTGTEEESEQSSSSDTR